LSRGGTLLVVAASFAGAALAAGVMWARMTAEGFDYSRESWAWPLAALVAAAYRPIALSSALSCWPPQRSPLPRTSLTYGDSSRVRSSSAAPSSWVCPQPSSTCAVETEPLMTRALRSVINWRRLLLGTPVLAAVAVGAYLLLGDRGIGDTPRAVLAETPPGAADDIGVRKGELARDFVGQAPDGTRCGSVISAGNPPSSTSGLPAARAASPNCRISSGCSANSASTTSMLSQ